MNEALKIFLSMSFSGGLLILALLFGKHFLKDKISRQWQYYIWLIVILRLLLPFGPKTNLMGKTYYAVDYAITQTAPLPQQSLPLNALENITPDANWEQSDENINQLAENLPTSYSLQDIKTWLINHIWLIWLLAALGLLIRKITIYQGFVQYIKAGLTPISDVKLLDQLSTVAEQEDIKKPVELCVNPLISSPLLIGFFHPCIVLPSTDIPKKNFQYIVLHELIHYKRRDMFYKWLVQVTLCLHWFHPLVHLMSLEITKACEFSCDEAVLSKIGCDHAKDYGKSLLDAMVAVGKYKENLGAVTLSENKQLLKERLCAIMKFKKQSKIVKILTGILTFCVVLCASFVGIYTVGNATGNVSSPLSSTPLDTTNKPSLSLDIKSSAVNILAATDNKISAEYNSDVYTVEINEQDSNWTVSISCKTRRNTNEETIKLYIPDIDYGDVNLNVDSGHLVCELIKSGNLVGNFYMASVFLSLPEGFVGSVDATANSGCFQLISKDDFRNTATTITDSGDWGEIYKPKNFKENGNIFTYTDGTKTNVIQVTRKGSGVMGIYTSDIFDILDFPYEQNTLWQDEWQDSFWEEDEQPFTFSSSDEKVKQYYEAGSLPLFQITFPLLDEEEQLKWLNRIYADQNLAFMGAAVNLLDKDCSLIQQLAEKFYQDNSVAYFSILTMHMSEETLEIWLNRALEDEQWSFQSLLFKALEKDDEFDKLEEKQKKAQIAEYQTVGITIDGKNYYYQGQLVHIFLDIRSNKSFYTLDVNPQGSVNIKVIRDMDNEITGVEYMTEEEVTELFGDEDEDEID